MLSLKGLVVVSALAMMMQPAFALNDGMPQSAGNGVAQAPLSVPPTTGQTPTTAPPAQACAKVARPQLTSEERAQRRALRAQREAEGLQRPQNAAHRVAHARPCRNPSL